MIFITHKSNIENYVNRMIKLEEKTSEIQNTNTN